MRNRIAVLSAAVAAALAAPTAVYAQAQGLEVRLSGQVNRALMNVDDGQKSNSFFVDNAISGTRFRISATAPMTPGIRAGAVFEAELLSNPSSDVSFDEADIADPTLAERHADIFFEGGFGKVSLGQGDGAANGGMEVDLSGTSVAHWSGTHSLGGGFEFKTGAGVGTGVTVGDTLTNQDFESRYDRIRYDSPKFGGFSVAASWGTKDNGRDVREAALWYSGDLGALGRVAGALGWSNQQANVATPGAIEDEVIGGSISWLHGSGLNVTLSYSERDLGAVGAERDGTFMYAKVGYKFGQHAVAIDWGNGEDMAATGVESDMIGIGYVWNPVRWAEIYAAAKRHSLDLAGVDADDINVVMIGTRIRF
jgi:predicted porin